VFVVHVGLVVLMADGFVGIVGFIGSDVLVGNTEFIGSLGHCGLIIVRRTIDVCAPIQACSSNLFRFVIYMASISSINIDCRCCSTFKSRTNLTIEAYQRVHSCSIHVIAYSILFNWNKLPLSSHHSLLRMHSLKIPPGFILTASSPLVDTHFRH
jgi:hypothetical protein